MQINSANTKITIVLSFIELHLSKPIKKTKKQSKNGIGKPSTHFYYRYFYKQCLRPRADKSSPLQAIQSSLVPGMTAIAFWCATCCPRQILDAWVQCSPSLPLLIPEKP